MNELPYDFVNVVSIVKKDKCVSVNNDEIIVNCKSLQDADYCAKILDLILEINNGTII